MKRDRVLKILAAGFALVIAFLAFASFLSYRQSRSIQDSSAELVRNHITMENLIDDLQSAQQRMDSIMFRLSRYGMLPTKDLPQEAVSVAANIQQIVEKVKSSSISSNWVELVDVTGRFADNVRDSLAQPPLEQDELQGLVKLHERFSQLAAKLVKDEAVRSSGIEAQIGSLSEELQAEAKWLLGGSVLLALVCAVITLFATNKIFRKMEQQTFELHQVSWHMLEGQEAAARRFSHEMHDELGQSLSGLKAMLVGLRPDEFVRRRSECVRLLEDCISNVRELSQLLRPVILDDFGLDASIRWLSERFHDRTSIQVNFDSNFTGRLADEVETHLFRITQEALTNVARHSGATKVNLALQLRGDELHLMIEDNGVGMDPSPKQRKPSLGMIGMQARAKQIGGELAISRSPLGGVRIEASAIARRALIDAEQKDAHFVG